MSFKIHPSLRRPPLWAAVTLIAGLGAGPPALAHVTGVTDSAKLRGNDFLEISPGSGSNGFAAESNRGVGIMAQQTGPTTSVIRFDRTVTAAGAFVQARNPGKPLNVKMTAYDEDGNRLRLFDDIQGNGDPRLQWTAVADRGDSSRVFIGVKSCHAVIREIRLEGNQPYALNRVNIYAKGLRPAPPRPSLARRPLAPIPPQIAAVPTPPLLIPPVTTVPTPVVVPTPIVPPVTPPITSVPPTVIPPPVTPPGQTPPYWIVPGLLLASTLIPGGGGDSDRPPSFPPVTPPNQPPVIPPVTPPQTPPPIIPPPSLPPGEVPVIPEPTAITLLLPGLIPLLALRRKRA